MLAAHGRKVGWEFMDTLHQNVANGRAERGIWPCRPVRPRAGFAATRSGRTRIAPLILRNRMSDAGPFPRANSAMRSMEDS